jgi:hypothetical protein
MNIPIEYINKSKYLLVKLSGAWTKDNMFKALEGIKIEADKHDKKLILFDTLNLSPPANEMIRFETGVKIAETFSGLYKIAALAQPGHITRFAETVAQNRGSIFQVFDSETDALNWLLS